MSRATLLLVALLAVSIAACIGPPPPTDRDRAVAVSDGGTTSSGPVSDDEPPLSDACGPATDCGGTCVDVQSSTQNCGACGQRCELDNATGVCVAGRCRLAFCDAGFFDEDGSVDNGCEAADGCDEGVACGTSCGSEGSTECNGGIARCAPPAEACNAVDDDCDGQCDDGTLPSCRGAVHRGNGTRGHIYSRDPSVVSTPPFNLEVDGAFYVYDQPAAGLAAIFRCRNAGGWNLLTTDASCEGLGTPAETVGYVARDARCGAVPLFRLLHPTTANHFYTTRTVERDNAVANLGYRFEGITAFVWLAPP